MLTLWRGATPLCRYAGFTGVRLGWTVIPKELTFADGSAVAADFNRIMSTAFNGASNIVQQGAMAALDPAGLAEISTLISCAAAGASVTRPAGRLALGGAASLGEVDSWAGGLVYAGITWATRRCCARRCWTSA